MLDKEIINMYQDGAEIENILDKYNICEHDVRYILKEANIDRKPTRFSEELKQRIIKHYISGMTQNEISNTLLVSCMGIKNTLMRANIEMRSTSDANKKYYRDSHYFDDIDNQNKAYILGLLFADGNNCIGQNKNCMHYTITLSLQEDDYNILEKVRQELKYEHPLIFDCKKHDNHKNQYRLCINDQHMSMRLNELGVVNNKSLQIQFPSFLESEFISHFIRGYFDWDGCIYYYDKSNKCSTQTVGTYEFCIGLSYILNELHINHNIRHPNQCGDSNTYILSTSGNKSSYAFLSWLYTNANLKMERKYTKYIDFCNKYNKPVM